MSEEQALFERYGRTFAPSQTLYEEGEDAGVCYLLQEGRVRLLKRIRRVERSLMILRPGDLFGEDALTSSSNARVRSSAAVALTGTRALALDRSTFAMLMTSHPEVTHRLIEQLVARIHRAEEQLENAMLRDSPSRVVNTLLRLAFRADPHKREVLLALTPLELASRVGIDVDGVKKVVGQLRDSGYLRVDGESILLFDVEALKDLFQMLELKEEVRAGFP